MDNDKRQDRLEALAEAVIPEAIEWVKEMRAYRVYQGKDPEYFRKARLGLGVVSGGIRLCATIENSRTNNLIQQRLLQEGSDGIKQLVGAASDAS